MTVEHARRPADSPSMRRTPMQSRSRERISTILDVTAALVDELGPEQVTTTLIAAHAGISVGSVYSYFRDRAAIFDAIVHRAITHQDEAIAATRDRFTGLTFIEASFEVIDAIAHVYRTEPGFRALWFSNLVSPEMLADMRRSDEDNARQVLARMQRNYGAYLDCADPIVAARLYVGLIDKGLGLAFRVDPEGDPQMIAETKQAVAAYLGSYLRPLAGLDGGSGSRPAPAAGSRRADTARATTGGQ